MRFTLQKFLGKKKLIKGDINCDDWNIWHEAIAGWINKDDVMENVLVI